MKKISKVVSENLAFLIVLFVCSICVTFAMLGKVSNNGYITLDGEDAKIEKYTEKFIEDSNAALYRIMNEDKPTDEETINEHEEATGQGAATSLDQVIARRKPDGDNDGGRGWQCSKYTAYLATGKKDYSSAHPDYGPVNGKDVATWLVRNFGWKYTDRPVEGAIGSGGFNTQYGHTVMYLYSTGSNTAMVNDANWTPLTVSTHNMNISGYVWVIPDDYTPSPTPTPVSKDEYVVKKGDTLGSIARKMGWYSGNKLFGDDGYTQKLAEYNGIANRGLIYPGQVIKRK